MKGKEEKSQVHINAGLKRQCLYGLAFGLDYQNAIIKIDQARNRAKDSMYV